MTITTQVVVVGNIVRDVELRYTASGKPVASLTIASTPRAYDKDKKEWGDGETVFTRCTAWDELAENISGSLMKGHRVVAVGVFKASSYTDREGNQKTGMDLIVDEIGPSLKYATATPLKRGKAAPQPQGPVQDQDGWAQVDDDDTPF